MHVARKRFGQNFLHDRDVIEQLVAAIAPRAGQHLIEIGPGQGALTRPLLERGVILDAIEIDRDLAALWEMERSTAQGLTVHCADALKFDFSSIIGPGERVRLVGNLPYNISTPLLFRFVDLAASLQDLHLMLQKEVVERMCAVPGNKIYGRLTVMLAPWFSCQPMVHVPASAFTPAPRVESAFVRLTPHDVAPFDLSCLKAYKAVVASAFSMRRKTLRNSLKTLLTADQISATGIDPKQRPETLAPADFARLAECAAQQHDELR